MLHGRVVRPRGQGPYTKPVRAVSVDESSIKNIKGVRVIRKGDFIGVVGPVEQDVIQAATQLKVKWAESATMPGNGNLWKTFRETPDLGERYAQATTATSRTRMNGAAHVLAASYSIGYQSHASFGPSAGIADVKADSALIMVASQGVYGQRTVLASLLGHEAGAGAGAVPRGRRLLRQEPAGRAGAGGRGHVADRRQARAGAADARPGARLGLLRAGHAGRHPGRRRRERQDRRVRLRLVPAGLELGRDDRGAARARRFRRTRSAAPTSRTPARSTRSRTIACSASRCRWGRRSHASPISGLRRRRRRCSRRSR